MEERKFIKLKKEEFGIKEYIKRDLGKGKISKLDIEYTPIGEKIIIYTSRPGLVIGRRGEKIEDLTSVLKRRFKLENPHIEIREIENPLFDSQVVADDIALSLERMGNLRFKVIAYKKLQEIINAGALGCEIRLSGKLPSDRAKSWRFAEGYLKKAGESRKEMNRAKVTALTKSGVIGVKVAIMPPEARIYDKIDINEEIKNKIKRSGKEEKTENDVMNEKQKIREVVEKTEKEIAEKIAKEDRKKEKTIGKAEKQEEKKEKEIVEQSVKKMEKRKETAREAEKEIANKIAKEDKKLEKVKEKAEEEEEEEEEEIVERAAKELEKKTGKDIRELKKLEKAISRKDSSKKPMVVLDKVEKIEDIVKTKLSPEEEGTAMKIEQEIKEGVPQEFIDKELKEDFKNKNEKNNKGKNTNRR